MIIDQDPDQTRQISNVIKSLFNKVYTQGNLAEAIKEFGEIKPQVLFLNLTINQRTDNLELIEQLTFNQESPTVIFGYNDSQESELLAHAIETGVHDIFARPYDADIISSKINRYYQTEKTQGRELQYSELNPPVRATLKFNMKLVAIDENGITLKGEHYISKGTSLPFKNTLMKEIFDSDTMEFMVTKTWLGDDWKEFFLFAEPKTPSEATSSALRRYILRKI